MNIIYLSGVSQDTNAEKIDISEYIRRGTEIKMAAHNIVNYAEATDEDDVVTLRG